MQKANALINEKSPYLLQHAYNPVNWMAWGDEAFQKAKSENKPIFLSIGYATCHWCHVMEHESFEDEQVAYLLNNYFVPIKVDREERPDVDSIYMTVTQMLTGHGGWPMTVILTPNLEPFFAGTYFPKFTRGGRVGLLEVLQQIQGFWENEKDEVMASVNEIMQNLKRDFTKLPNNNFDINTLESAYNRLNANFDEFYGGFAQAPKFPMGHNILFLLRYYHRTKSENALNLINKTLIEMRLGGIYDQIGFGFHRYSTDERWLLPHFEKMLYDNALLLMAFSEAFQLTSIPLYKATALEIAEFVISQMQSENGSFYSAFDADSEGEEGKYYVWKVDEIKEILAEDAQFFIDAFEFDEEGNFVHETGFAHSGDNIPFISDKNSIYFIEQNEEYIGKINLLRAKLLEKRKTRIAPILDDKVLTDWNGLMIAAMANTGKILREEKLIETAQKAEAFISNKLIIKNELYHRYRDNDTAISAMLDDYAYLILGLLNLYSSTYQVDYLKKAIKHCDVMIEKFWDNENGGFFSTEAGKSDLIVRQKEAYDGAMPSGNSTAYMILQRLFRITANSKYIELAEKLSQAFSGLISKSPHSFAMMMCGLEYNQAETKDLVIVANTYAEAKDFIATRNNVYEPHLEILVKTSNNRIEEFAMHCKDLKMLNNKPTAYLCQNFTCSLPTNEIVGI